MQNAEAKRIVMRATRAASRGFTLLEIMLVVTIIGVIMGGVAVALFSKKKKIDIQMTKTRVASVSSAVKEYMMQNNNACPKSVDELVQQKYLEKAAGKDSWSKEFIFKCPGTNDPDGADVQSSGPDKQPDTADDIRAWEQ